MSELAAALRRSCRGRRRDRRPADRRSGPGATPRAARRARARARRCAAGGRRARPGRRAAASGSAACTASTRPPARCRVASRTRTRCRRELVLAADDDAVRGRVGGEHVERLGRGDAEAAALADREAVVAAVLADGACRAQSTIVARAVAEAAVAREESRACPRRRGSRGPGSRPWRRRRARPRRRSRGPRGLRQPGEREAQARERLGGAARRACRSGPWRRRRRRRAAARRRRRRSARSGRSPARRRRGGRRARSSRRSAARRCRGRTGSGSPPPA